MSDHSFAAIQREIWYGPSAMAWALSSSQDCMCCKGCHQTPDARCMEGRTFLQCPGKKGHSVVRCGKHPCCQPIRQWHGPRSIMALDLSCITMALEQGLQRFMSESMTTFAHDLPNLGRRLLTSMLPFHGPRGCSDELPYLADLTRTSETLVLPQKYVAKPSYGKRTTDGGR